MKRSGKPDATTVAIFAVAGLAAVGMIVAVVVGGTGQPPGDEQAAPAPTTPSRTTTAPTPTSTTPLTVVVPEDPNEVKVGDCVVNIGTDENPRMRKASCSSGRTGLSTVLSIDVTTQGLHSALDACQSTPGTTHYYIEREPVGRYTRSTLWCLRQL